MVTLVLLFSLLLPRCHWWSPLLQAAAGVDWNAADVQVTHEQMQAMCQALALQGKQLEDASGQGNNCCLYVVASCIHGTDPKGRDESSRQIAAKLRQRTAAYLENQLAAEPAGVWAEALAALAGYGELDSPGAEAAAHRHVQQLQDDAPFCMADLAALAQLLTDTASVQITAYNPTWAAENGFCCTLTAPGAGGAAGAKPAAHIHMANVWAGWVAGDPAARRPGAAGVLNHWVMVSERPAGGRAAPAAAVKLEAQQAATTAWQHSGWQGPSQSRAGSWSQQGCLALSLLVAAVLLPLRPLQQLAVQHLKKQQQEQQQQQRQVAAVQHL